MKPSTSLKSLIGKATPGTVHWLKSEVLRVRGSGSGRKTISVLDVGSSHGRVWREMASSGWLKHHDIILRVTLFDANVESQNITSEEENLYLESELGTAPKDLAKFKPDEFDLVSALHVIEHLSKEDGYLLLYQINRICAHSVIGTPNGFLWQPPFHANPFQAHISGWTSRELRSLGWITQFGEGGLKCLLGPGSVPKWKTSNSKLRRFLSGPERIVLAISQLLLFPFPSLHGLVFAVRRERAFDIDAYTQSHRV